MCVYKYYLLIYHILIISNRIRCMLASSAVDRGFEPRSGQTKDYKLGICCFSAKHAALRRKTLKEQRLVGSESE